MAAIETQGLTLQQAAKRARITVQALRVAIHGDPAQLSVRTVYALVARLGLPLSVVAPQLHSASSA